MYGLKYESLIFRLRQPETKIGRHSSNDIHITKSLKVSRFHAVISFLGESLLIKDISEWGVFLNNVEISKQRWAELKLGDVIALGALTKEEGGRILEVVAWESEDKNSTVTIRKEPEVVDITEDDGDDVIDISDDETTIQCNNLESSGLLAAHVPEETPITVLSDEEDEVLLLTAPSKSVETIPEPTIFVELPLTDQAAVSFDENQIDSTIEAIEEKSSVFEAEKEPLVVEMEEKPLVCETEEKPLLPLIDTKQTFIDVTPPMNGLLMRAPSGYPKALQSILNYFSDDDSYSSYDELNNLSVSDHVNLDQKNIEFCPSAGNVPDIKIKLTSQTSKKIKVEGNPLLENGVEENAHVGREKEYKSPLGVFTKFYDENEENEYENEAESDNTSPSPFNVKSEAQIIHRTLLTNKIARIAIISPLPNKSFATKRRKRERSESPDAIFQRVVNAELIHKSSVCPLSPKSKNSSRESQKKLSTISTVSKNKKALLRYSGTASAQAVVKKQAREKIKVLYPAPPKKIQRISETRIQAKVKVTDKNRGDFLTKLDPTPCHQSPTKVVKSKNSKAVSSNPKAITKPVKSKNNRTPPNQPPIPITPPPPADPEPSPVTRNKHRRSINVPAVRIDDTLSEMVPYVISSGKIETFVNFTNISPLGVPGSFGKSILKKSIGEAQSSGEKKRVRFPRKIVTHLKHNENDLSKFSFSTMMKKEILPEGESYNCAKFKSKNQSFKSHNRDYDRTSCENTKFNRIKERDPRLRSLNRTM